MSGDIGSLVSLCAQLPRPWLVGVDVDGTLAPIVPRPEMSRLAPHALEVLEALIDCVGVSVAVVSGRPLADLRHRFEFPGGAMLLGSHGAEVGTEVDRRTDVEQTLMDETEAELEAISACLPGSWIEHKPLAIALHVRQVDDALGEHTLTDLGDTYSTVAGITMHRGHKVMELSIRPSSKVLAFTNLRTRLEPATSFFIGDDSSDEHVFGSLGPRDMSIKVGPGPTGARHRLSDPDAVVALLRGLSESVSTGVR